MNEERAHPSHVEALSEINVRASCRSATPLVPIFNSPIAPRLSEDRLIPITNLPLILIGGSDKIGSALARERIMVYLPFSPSARASTVNRSARQAALIYVYTLIILIYIKIERRDVRIRIARRKLM